MKKTEKIRIKIIKNKKEIKMKLKNRLIKNKNKISRILEIRMKKKSKLNH
jgi:hypothetical protein